MLAQLHRCCAHCNAVLAAAATKRECITSRPRVRRLPTLGGGTSCDPPATRSRLCAGADRRASTARKHLGRCWIRDLQTACPC
jgi:hypothetical protein